MSTTLAQMEARLAKATQQASVLDHEWPEPDDFCNARGGDFMRRVATDVELLLPVVRAALKLFKEIDAARQTHTGDRAAQQRGNQALADLRAALLPFTTNGAADGNG